MRALGVIEGEALELGSSAADVVPHEVASLMGSACRELRTRGDGACALHAAFSRIDIGDVLQVESRGAFCGRFWDIRWMSFVPACGPRSNISYRWC